MKFDKNIVLKLRNSIYCILFLSLFCTAQKEYNFTGYITDSKTGETLIGANVYNTSSKQGAVSNAYGYFNLSTTKGETQIICSYIGYSTDTLNINIQSNLNHNFNLSIEPNNLNEVLLESQESNIESTQSSVINIPIKQIKTIPALLGEKDILKSIQLLPGVQSGNEGTSGFYVRGGGPDQNLILLDGVNIYHASHLLGFFSVFNEDAVKNINLTKGGFPARFGGRLSSVLEIDMKEGNMKEWKGEGGMGIISGKLTIEGPIKKDKTSILISGRRTWIDLLKEPIVNALENKIDFNDSDGNYYFYDINAKLNHKFSEKDRLYISVYTGQDKFSTNINEKSVTSEEVESWGETNAVSSRFINPLNSSTTTFNGNTNFGLSWSNLITSIRWNHVLNKKMFMNTTLLYSQYKFENTITTNNTTTETLENNELTDQESDNNNVINESSNYLYRSGIEDLGVKVDIDYFLNRKHNLKFGISYIKHNFFPGYMDWSADYQDFNIDTIITFSDNLRPDNAFIYLEDNYKINERLSTNIGIHYSFFHVNKKLYHSPQPRISLRYLTTETSSLKLSYATMQQNIHLLTNSSFGLPNDMWVPATDLVAPQFSQQVVLGYNKLFNKNKYEVSCEIYYKNMENLVTFSEGTNILGTSFSAWEERVENDGKGLSKGIELFLQKKTGKLTGWMGYTFSKTTRKFENINLGNEYSYKFDRTHDLSIVASYELKKGVNINTTWVYGTGNAITMPTSRYFVIPEGGNNAVVYFDYGEKNDFRMAPYHRLDIGCNFTKIKKWGERVWTISIYNVYNRKNPFFIYFEDEWENGIKEKQAVQISLFPIIPSIRYSFKF